MGSGIMVFGEELGAAGLFILFQSWAGSRFIGLGQKISKMDLGLIILGLRLRLVGFSDLGVEIL